MMMMTVAVMVLGSVQDVFIEVLIDVFRDAFIGTFKASTSDEL